MKVLDSYFRTRNPFMLEQNHNLLLFNMEKISSEVEKVKASPIALVIVKLNVMMRSLTEENINKDDLCRESAVCLNLLHKACSSFKCSPPTHVSLRTTSKDDIPDIEKCSITGQGAIVAAKGIDNCFYVVVKNCNNEPCHYKKVVFDVSAYSVTESKPKQIFHNSHYQKGVIKVSYNYNMDGLYKFAIRLDSKPISKSALEVFVRSRSKFWPKFSCKKKIDCFNLCQSAGICVNSAGVIFLCDVYNSHIQVYKNHSFSYIIGKPGKKCGQLNKPLGIALDVDENIIVCDSGNNRLQLFSISGKYLRQSKCNAGFLKPVDVEIMKTTNCILATHSNFLVSIFSSSLNELNRVDLSTLCSVRNGSFFGICCGFLDEIFLTDQYSGKVYVIHYDEVKFHHNRTIEVATPTNGRKLQPRLCGIVMDNDGYILVTDGANKAVVALTYESHEIGRWTVNGSPQFIAPMIGNAYLVTEAGCSDKVCLYGTTSCKQTVNR